LIKDGSSINGLSALSSEERLILLGDGSLTLLLEALLRERVSVEVKRNSTSLLGPEAALYLDEVEGGESVEREVWLNVNGERLVFAHSIVPVSSIEPWLLESLSEGTEPLGRVLKNREIPVLKEALEIAVISAPEVSADLQIDPDTRFYARRYKLTNRVEGGGWIIKAEICEVLCPSLVSPL
jgi:chorismate-pyruvate lyase